MQLNKSSFVLGNIAGSVVVGLIVVACGGGDSPQFFVAPPINTDGGAGAGAGAGPGAGTIKASNVIVRSGTQTASLKDGIVYVQANQLPDNTKVLASNVALVTTSNDLTSNDLQSALDKEIAVDVSKAIVGVWDVENVVRGGCGQPTGRVQFKADGTFEMLSGSLDVAGAYAADTAQPGTACIGFGSYKYTVLEGAFKFVSADPLSGNYPPGTGNTTAGVTIKATDNSLTLYGGFNGQLSLLTKVIEKTSTKPAAAAKSTIAMATPVDIDGARDSKMAKLTRE